MIMPNYLITFQDFNYLMISHHYDIILQYLFDKEKKAQAQSLFKKPVRDQYPTHSMCSSLQKKKLMGVKCQMPVHWVLSCQTLHGTERERYYNT